MRFKVPQNIDMQDRVIGPLTMIQFVELVVGFGLCYLVYNSLPRPAVWIILIPLAVISLAIVFIKINERPFHIFLSSVVMFMIQPNKRLWKQDETSDTTFEFVEDSKKIKVVEGKIVSKEDISAVAKKTDESKI